MVMFTRPSLALRRQENAADRARLRDYLVGRCATIAELVHDLHMDAPHLHGLLRTLKRQRVVCKYDENTYTLTGQAPQRKPRDVKPRTAWANGIPHQTSVPAQQVGVQRDPLVAALFGPAAAGAAHE
jgi:hypothetical protein